MRKVVLQKERVYDESKYYINNEYLMLCKVHNGLRLVDLKQATVQPRIYSSLKALLESEFISDFYLVDKDKLGKFLDGNREFELLSNTTVHIDDIDIVKYDYAYHSKDTLYYLWKGEKYCYFKALSKKLIPGKVSDARDAIEYMIKSGETVHEFTDTKELWEWVDKTFTIECKVL